MKPTTTNPQGGTMRGRGPLHRGDPTRRIESRPDTIPDGVTVSHLTRASSRVWGWVELTFPLADLDDAGARMLAAIRHRSGCDRLTDHGDGTVTVLLVDSTDSPVLFAEDLLSYEERLIRHNGKSPEEAARLARVFERPGHPKPYHAYEFGKRLLFGERLTQRYPYPSAAATFNAFAATFEDWARAGGFDYLPESGSSVPQLEALCR